MTKLKLRTQGNADSKAWSQDFNPGNMTLVSLKQTFNLHECMYELHIGFEF